jgi:hypothetical protein
MVSLTSFPALSYIKDSLKCNQIFI